MYEESRRQEESERVIDELRSTITALQAQSGVVQSGIPSSLDAVQSESSIITETPPRSPQSPSRSPQQSPRSTRGFSASGPSSPGKHGLSRLPRVSCLVSPGR